MQSSHITMILYLGPPEYSTALWGSRVPHFPNHLFALQLYGMGPSGGRCGSSYIPLHIHFPTYCGAALADIQYSRALNMQGKIAEAKALSQLFMYRNNCFQF